MKAISIINQKGGVGKSTAAHALGYGLANRGYKTLLIDTDPQCNLTYITGLNSIYNDVSSIMGGSFAEDAIQPLTDELDFIASNPALAGADVTYTELGKEYILKQALEPLQDKYDFAIIDTPPALGVLTINALTASYGAIIPAQADILSLQGIGQLYNTVQAVQQYTNQKLIILGIVLTRYQHWTTLTADISQLMKDTAKQLDTKVYKSSIREAIAVKEAQAKRQDIFTYAPSANVTKDFNSFVDEFIKGV